MEISKTELSKRKPNRLRDYDYSQNGAYFVTICTKDKDKIFWTVGANCVRPNEPPLSCFGEIVDNEVQKLKGIYDCVSIDKYVIMPNHIHLIITIMSYENGRTQFAPTISRIIKQFKGRISKQIGHTVWQKSFHDHIIRNEKDYLKIWNYIDTNPVKWEEDCFFN